MIKTVILDLDGTIYLGKQPIKGAKEKIEELKSKGINVLFLTNAATRTRESLTEKLTSMGFPADKEDVYCSSYTMAKYVEKNHPGARVFVIGEDGLREELLRIGAGIVEKDADIVAVGLDRKFTYQKLAQALIELRNGAMLIASNRDPNFPVEDCYRPGTGAILAAVEKAAGITAEIVVGKPGSYGFEIIKQEKGAREEETLLVGDRLDSDIAFARNCGIRSALVLTGVNKENEIREIRPDFVIGSIADLNLP